MFCQSLFVILYFFLSSLHYLSYDLRLLVTTLVSCGHCVVCHLRFTASDLPLWYMHLQTFLPIRSEKCMIKVWCFFSFLFFSIQIPTDTKENICCCNFTLYCCLIDNLHNHVHVYIKNIYMYTVWSCKRVFCFS